MEGRPLTGPAAEFKKRLEFALLMRDIRAHEAKEDAVMNEKTNTQSPETRSLPLREQDRLNGEAGMVRGCVEKR